MGGGVRINILEVAIIKRRKRCRGDREMMATGRPDKRTYSGATEKTQGFQREWKWRRNTDIHRHALEDDDNDGNEADKG